MLRRLADKLARRGLVRKRWTKKEVYKVFEELEIELVAEGIPPKVVDLLREGLADRLDGVETKGNPESTVRKALKDFILERTPRPLSPEDLIPPAEDPDKVIFFGFNGVGKSLSIVKLARFLHDRGMPVLVVSADTFRAAAGDQLRGYCRAAGVPIFVGERGADPAAVSYDAISMASSKGIKYVLIDTAGRNYLDRNLAEELRKIVRISNPRLKVLVLDGLAGSDIVNQCDSFGEAVGIDALVVTKVDAGGLATPLFASLYCEKPILFLGMGQGFGDIGLFDPEAAVEFILK